MSKVDAEIIVKNKEYTRKLEFEQSLLDRCKEFMEGEHQKIKDEKLKVKERANVRMISDDIIRLKIELEKA